jgi:hypothetical protein
VTGSLGALCVATGLTLASATAACQGVSFPSTHYGANGFPASEQLWEAGFSTDRFTEHTKHPDSTAGKLRDYVHKQTDGFNILHLKYSFPWRPVHLMIGTGVHWGWIAEKPSRFLQNDFRHHDAGYEMVPVAGTGSGPLYGLSLSMDRWFSPAVLQNEELRLIAPLFVGTELTLSSSVHDWAIRGGIRSGRWTIMNKDIPSISLLARKGIRVGPSHWLKHPLYSKNELSNTYGLMSAVLHLPTDKWWDPPALVPAFEFGMTWHTGLYRGFPDTTAARQFYDLQAAGQLKDARPPRVAEKLCTFAFSWSEGDVALESYNDSCGGKDIGPTFGARFYFRWRNFPGSGRPRRT